MLMFVGDYCRKIWIMMRFCEQLKVLKSLTLQLSDMLNNFTYLLDNMAYYCLSSAVVFLMNE